MPWLGSFGWLSNARSEDVPWYLAGGIPAANCIAAYQPIGAASLAASYVNLANPGTYDCTAPTAAPTFAAATGWTFNGSTQYLDTGLDPALNATTGWTLIVRCSGVLNSGFLAGAYNTNYYGFAPNRATARKYYHGASGDALVAVPGVTSGVLALAGAKAYYNGVVEAGTITYTATDFPSILIGTTSTLWYQGEIQAVAIYDSVLTAAQVLAISNAMAALPFDVTIPAYPAPVVGDGEFTIAFMPDSHIGTWMTYSDVQETFDFLRDNKTRLKIEAVLHGGDYHDGVDQTEDRAAFVSSIASIEDIPHMVVIGNHDYDLNDGPRNSTVHNGVFGQSYYTGKSWWSGGFYEAGHAENAYLLLTIAAVDYIFIALEFFPRQGVIDWANALLTTHAAKKAIIITHAYEYTDGTPYAVGDNYGPDDVGLLGITDADYHWGDEMWDELIKLHDNVILVHSAHVNPCARHVANSDGGQAVNQIVANYQGDWGDHLYNTMIRYLIFNPTTETIRVQSFSAVYRVWFNDPAQQFTLTY